MKRIYIAGPYNGENIIECLENMRRGMRVGSLVLQAGFAPWTPWHDFHHHLMLRGDETLDINTYYEFSLAWLEVADAMLVLPGWRDSKGTSGEVEFAKSRNILMFFLRDTNDYFVRLAIDKMRRYFKEQE